MKFIVIGNVIAWIALLVMVYSGFVKQNNINFSNNSIFQLQKINTK